MIVEGIGLHSGVKTSVRFHLEDGPTRFRCGQTFIPATLASVVATPRCTVLGTAGVQVALVEHLLAALHISGWWSGLVLEVLGPEVPILDGSSGEWLELLNTLGSPPKAPSALRLERSVSWLDGDTQLHATPCEGIDAPSLSVSIDFAHETIGRQNWSGTQKTYTELAQARTFGFESELHELREAGLVRGGSLENAIVFGNEGPLRPLRYPDEPVRHKALDALGDAYLLAQPLDAHLDVMRGSHRSHVAFMTLLKRLHSEDS